MKDSLEADLCSVVMDQTCFYKLIVQAFWLHFCTFMLSLKVPCLE